MNYKKYMVLDHDGNHDYDLTVETTNEGELFCLSHSNGDQWTEHTKGTLALSMVDTGNGYQFDRKLKNLDYSIAFCVRLLLNFEVEIHDQNPANKLKGRIILDETLMLV